MSKINRMLVIDSVFAYEYGLNLAQAAVYNVMRYTPTYCKSQIINGEVYYFVSRNMMCEKLRLVTDKPDTMYRYYRQIEKAGLIKTAKVGSADYIHIVAEHSAKWNSEIYPRVGNLSEQLGNSSENTPENSEIHPTYIREYIVSKDIEREKNPLSVYEEANFPNSSFNDNTPQVPAPPPLSPYETEVMNDFISSDPESAVKNIFSRVKQYHVDYPGTGKRICEAAKNMLSPDQYSDVLKKWISHYADKAEFFKRPTSRLMRGRGNLVSWVKREKPVAKDKEIDKSTFESPIMRAQKRAMEKELSQRLQPSAA